MLTRKKAIAGDGKRERTRRKLIETTLALVAERGFASVSLAEIAARAGMTTGAIYSNFGSKDDLMLAVMERFMARQFERFSAIPTGSDFMADAHGAGEVFRETLSLELTRTEDVLSALAARRRDGQRLVGFAAEHGDGALAYGREKLDRKGLETRACECYSLVKREFDRLLPALHQTDTVS